MAGNNIYASADNLPKDSGNRYMMAPFDPSGSGFVLPMANPVSGSFGGWVMGHMTNQIADTMTSTGAISSGVDLGGYTVRGLTVAQAGSGTQFVFQVSASGGVYSTILDPVTNNQLSASGRTDGQYTLGWGSALQSLQYYRFVRISAANLQTAARTFVWSVST